MGKNGIKTNKELKRDSKMKGLRKTITNALVGLFAVGMVLNFSGCSKEFSPIGLNDDQVDANQNMLNIFAIDDVQPSLQKVITVSNWIEKKKGGVLQLKYKVKRKKGKKDVGFIAQDLDEVQQKYNIEENLQLVLKSNPDRLEATQGKLIPLLVNAIKELTARVEELENE